MHHHLDQVPCARSVSAKAVLQHYTCACTHHYRLLTAAGTRGWGSTLSVRSGTSGPLKFPRWNGSCRADTTTLSPLSKSVLERVLPSSLFQGASPAKLFLSRHAILSARIHAVMRVMVTVTMEVKAASTVLAAWGPTATIAPHDAWCHHHQSHQHHRHHCAPMHRMRFGQWKVVLQAEHVQRPSPCSKRAGR